MRKSPGRSHTPVCLSASLNQHLNMYALAATAAGVGLLALAPPAEAKIIYTKTHQVITMNGISPIDLNPDGNADFVVQNYQFSWGLFVQGAVGNAIEGSGQTAAAVKKGAAIGSRQHFISNSFVRGEDMVWLACTTEGTNCWLSGPWLNVTNRYLGLRFQMAGKDHYGWARLSTKSDGFQVTATLTGYAYETVANKGLRAGQTSGEEEDASLTSNARVRDSHATALKPVSQTSQTASLGQLALGTRAVKPWRTK